MTVRLWASLLYIGITYIQEYLMEFNFLIHYKRCEQITINFCLVGYMLHNHVFAAE